MSSVASLRSKVVEACRSLHCFVQQEKICGLARYIRGADGLKPYKSFPPSPQVPPECWLSQLARRIQTATRQSLSQEATQFCRRAFIYSTERSPACGLASILAARQSPRVA